MKVYNTCLNISSSLNGRDFWLEPGLFAKQSDLRIRILFAILAVSPEDIDFSNPQNKWGLS